MTTGCTFTPTNLCCSSRLHAEEHAYVGNVTFPPWTLLTLLWGLGLGSGAWIIHPQACYLVSSADFQNIRALRLDVIATRSTPAWTTSLMRPAFNSKSSDDTDVGRLIFTLDSPSSPLDCRVYLPAQLVSGEDRQTKERSEGWSQTLLCDCISSNCLWRWEMSFNSGLKVAFYITGPLLAHLIPIKLLYLSECQEPEISETVLA